MKVINFTATIYRESPGDFGDQRAMVGIEADGHLVFAHEVPLEMNTPDALAEGVYAFTHRLLEVLQS